RELGRRIAARIPGCDSPHLKREGILDMLAANRAPVGPLRVQRISAALALWLIVVLASCPALAQARPVELTGYVQWIAANRLMLILRDGSGVVAVDLTRVPLDQYQTLSQRDPVAVLGVVSDDNRRLIGTSIIRFPEYQAP